MYVVVRQDLDKTYRMVQGSHALAQYSLDFPELFNKWNNRTIVFLGVKHEGQLLKLANELLNKEKFSMFYEEDLNGELTSLACLSDEKTFEKYNVVR